MLSFLKEGAAKDRMNLANFDENSRPNHKWVSCQQDVENYNNFRSPMRTFGLKQVLNTDSAAGFEPDVSKKLKRNSFLVAASSPTNTCSETSSVAFLNQKKRRERAQSEPKQLAVGLKQGVFVPKR